MKKFLFLLLVGSFLIWNPALAQAEEATDDDRLPPEKAHIIYDKLLTPEKPVTMAPTVKQTTAEKQEKEPMPEEIAKVLRQQGIALRGQNGQWQFVHEGLQFYLLIDTKNNRLRLMTPVAKLDTLRKNPDFIEVDLLQKMLKSNYLATGDTRLCMNKQVLWAAFLHPFDSLSERDLLSALDQLVEVAKKTHGDLG